MESRTVQVGDNIQGQNYNFPITLIDSQGIHASTYIIIPQDNKWPVQSYHFLQVPAMTEGTKCELFATTYQYGRVKSLEKIYTTGPTTLKDLKVEAINRNINISDRYHVICKSIQNELPSLEWQKQNILDMSNRDLVSKEELDLVNSYGSYSFSSMNNDLRYHPNQEAPINRTIDKMQPLDKDIIVFRGINRFNFLPLNIGEIFDSYGYLSTSMSATLITEGACQLNEGAVMKIRVSKGTKCIYLPSTERELLFSHGIKLQLIDVFYNSLYCPKDDNFATNKNVVLFDFIME